MNIRRWLGKLKRLILRRPDANQAHCQYELQRFLKHSVMHKDPLSAEFLDTQLRIYIHIIEKGFSFEHPKKGFGRERLKYLISLLENCERCTEPERVSEAYEKGKRILSLYTRYALENRVDCSFIPEKYRNEENLDDVGVALFRNGQQLNEMNFYEFAHSRHSYRYFSDREITDETAEEIVSLSQTAPSACNRQSVKVYFLRNEDTIAKVLDVQEGARGFTNVKGLFIVTASLSSYTYIKEYSTAYVDGGIFVMNLLYALSYYGLGSCPLLFDDSQQYGKQLRTLVPIPQGDVVVGMVAAGYYKDEPMKYAKSVRKDVRDVLIKCD